MPMLDFEDWMWRSLGVVTANLMLGIRDSELAKVILKRSAAEFESRHRVIEESLPKSLMLLYVKKMAMPNTPLSSGRF
ncbi:hypothetical protein Tco_0760287 [Tanacetum coccineum]